MNDPMIIDIDPLSSYEAQYDYPLPVPQFYPPPPHPYPYKNDHPTCLPQAPYQTLPNGTEDTNQNLSSQDYDMDTKGQIAELPEEEDIKPDIVPIEPVNKKRVSRAKGKTSSYWNKKITDKNFAFYGCAVCNISYTNLTDLDQHVLIHENRMTSYDVRMNNIKKRKRLKKEKKKLKKVSTKGKVKEEIGIEIKPEDGYIGTEKATDFSGGDNKSGVKSCTDEIKENNPVISKNTDNQHSINVYKCFGCNKQFALSYYLRIHVRSHTDEKPYPCSMCAQSFITASKRARHTKRIHLAIRHQCRICYMYFSRFELLVKHFDKKHEADKLDGEPYDYNAILPYIKELEEQLREEKEKKPKTEDPWEIPPANAPAAPNKTVEPIAKEETFISKEEDKVALPPNIEFYDESKDFAGPLPTAKVTLEEVGVNVGIKVEMEEERSSPRIQETDDHGADDDHCKDDYDNDDDDNDDDDEDVKKEREPPSEEEYFPSNTWVVSPPPLPPPSSPKSHVRPHSTSCQICHKKLSSKSYLRVHMRTHTGEKPFTCYICKRGFITASKMHRHVLTHDESWDTKDCIKEEVDPEPEVKVEVGTEEDPLKKTKKSKVKKKKPKMTNKSKKTFFEKKVKKHQKWPHVCDFCHRRFLHLETLEVHKKSHEESGNILHKCHFCLLPQIDKESLKVHEATHTGKKPYLCTLCGNNYTKRATMIYHRKARCNPVDAGEKTFICDICNKRYNAHSKLQRHMATHSTCKFTFRYECPVCAHMFHTRYHVQMHLRTHMKEGLILEENRNAVLAMVLQNARKIPKNGDNSTAPQLPALSVDEKDERSRICNICGQIFQHFYYLEEHLKTHGSKIAIQDLDKEEEKKYTCQVCSKSFKLHYYLKLHSYTHTKEKPFICQQCGKGFITKGKLKRHLETHQGLKKYQCHICYKFFTRPSYLRIHVRTIHGTQDYNFRDYGIGVPIGTISNNL